MPCTFYFCVLWANTEWMWCVSLVFSILISNFGSLDGRCVLYINLGRCGQYAGAWFENWPMRPVRGLYTPCRKGSLNKWPEKCRTKKWLEFDGLKNKGQIVSKFKISESVTYQWGSPRGSGSAQEVMQTSTVSGMTHPCISFADFSWNCWHYVNVGISDDQQQQTESTPSSSDTTLAVKPSVISA